MSPMQQTGRATPLKPRELIAQFLSAGLPRAAAKLQLRRLARLEWWGNDTYSASVDRDAPHGMGAEVRVVHISIHRRDRAPCTDWRHFQQIKSDILGAEFEAIELYPAESRVVDGANEYHLWGLQLADGSPLAFPVGFEHGMRTDDPVFAGAVQRPHEPDFQPVAFIGVECPQCEHQFMPTLTPKCPNCGYTRNSP